MSENSFSFHNGDQIRFPLLISVPHAGRTYPKSLLRNLNIPASHLQRLEDRYSDLLAKNAIEAGFPTIIAHKPRAWIDLNRSKLEIDADIIDGLSKSHVTMPSRKVRGGLGLIPRRLSGAGELWQQKWSWDDIASRITLDHEPYHAEISKLLKKMQRTFGCAILLDLHSMPPLDLTDDTQPKIVVGDRFGRSAGARYSEFAMSVFERSGLASQLNLPYSGGYILERHASLDQNIHAIQIEVDRSCYLDVSLTEPGYGLPTIAKTISELAFELVDQANGKTLLEAAE
ncbi:MAG: N-formylglutamate amidohydrolase [Parasphingorhabdus sp.]